MYMLNIAIIFFKCSFIESANVIIIMHIVTSTIITVVSAVAVLDKNFDVQGGMDDIWCGIFCCIYFASCECFIICFFTIITAIVIDRYLMIFCFLVKL